MFVRRTQLNQSDDLSQSSMTFNSQFRTADLLDQPFGQSLRHYEDCCYRSGLSQARGLRSLMSFALQGLPES